MANDGLQLLANPLSVLAFDQEDDSFIGIFKDTEAASDYLNNKDWTADNWSASVTGNVWSETWKDPDNNNHNVSYVYVGDTEALKQYAIPAGKQTQDTDNIVKRMQVLASVLAGLQPNRPTKKKK